MSECLRDIGLEEECVKVGSKGSCMLHTRWCRSMAGEEYARIYSWGNDPQRVASSPCSFPYVRPLTAQAQGDYEAASPCKHIDLPQTVLEPILVRYAVSNGFTCRFDTKFIAFERDPFNSIISTVQDKISGHTYTIRSKYLFGCDGARSQVLRQLKIPLIKKPGQGLAINVLVKADLSHLVESRQGNLHWVMQPDEEHPDFGWIGLVRMIKPWTE